MARHFLAYPFLGVPKPSWGSPKKERQGLNAVLTYLEPTSDSSEDSSSGRGKRGTFCLLADFRTPSRRSAVAHSWPVDMFWVDVSRGQHIGAQEAKTLAMGKRSNFQKEEHKT